MKTKFTPIVKFKKSELDKSEEMVQNFTIKLQKAENSLKAEYELLLQISEPTAGTISEYQSNKLLLHRQREIIIEATHLVKELKSELSLAKERHKSAYIEFEKYKYLESEEIKKMLHEIQVKESKDLDEVALQAFMNRRFTS